MKNPHRIDSGYKMEITLVDDVYPIIGEYLNIPDLINLIRTSRSMLTLILPKLRVKHKQRQILESRLLKYVPRFGTKRKTIRVDSAMPRRLPLLTHPLGVPDVGPSGKPIKENVKSNDAWYTMYHKMIMRQPLRKFSLSEIELILRSNIWVIPEAIEKIVQESPPGYIIDNLITIKNPNSSVCNYLYANGYQDRFDQESGSDWSPPIKLV